VYASLGIQRNCSDQYLGAAYAFDDRRGGVLVLREARQGELGALCLGAAQPVGFDWHPQTGVLYASNNGPDHLGYDQPPEYFSKLAAGSFHGMPWFQYDGQQLRRDDCVSSAPPRPAAQVAKPVATFPSRNAPLGMAFVPEGAMDKSLEFDAVVALHGSWGTKPSGGFIGARPRGARPGWWRCASSMARWCVWTIWSAAFSCPTASAGRVRLAWPSARTARCISAATAITGIVQTEADALIRLT